MTVNCADSITRGASVTSATIAGMFPDASPPSASREGGVPGRATSPSRAEPGAFREVAERISPRPQGEVRRSASGRAQLLERLAEQFDEVGAIRIDHALNLSTDQARSLLPIIQSAAAVVQRLRGQREVATPALVEALTRARRELKAAGAVSDATRQQLQAAHGQAMDRARQQLDGLRQQMVATLSPDQDQALRSTSRGSGPAGRVSSSVGEDVHRGGPFREHALLRSLISDTFLALLWARAR